MEEGKPTGITREDVHKLDEVRFEGQPAQIYRANTDAAVGEERVILELDIGGTRLAVYGYVRGSEFIEVDRGRLD